MLLKTVIKPYSCDVKLGVQLLQCPNGRARAMISITTMHLYSDLKPILIELQFVPKAHGSPCKPEQLNLSCACTAESPL